MSSPLRTAHVLAATLLAFALAACAAPRGATRTPPVPLGDDVRADRPAARIADDGRVWTDADRSPPVPGLEPAPVVSESVTWRTVTTVVEVPAHEPPAAGTWSSGGAYDAGTHGWRYDDGYRGRRSRETWFPYGTAIGFGVGSLLDGHWHHGWHRGGRHRHHHHHGAWLGGSLGLLFDLGRWSR